jgi:hypothetical protein
VCIPGGHATVKCHVTDQVDYQILLGTDALKALGMRLRGPCGLDYLGEATPKSIGLIAGLNEQFETKSNVTCSNATAEKIKDLSWADSSVSQQLVGYDSNLQKKLKDTKLSQNLTGLRRKVKSRNTRMLRIGTVAGVINQIKRKMVFMKSKLTVNGIKNNRCRQKCPEKRHARIRAVVVIVKADRYKQELMRRDVRIADLRIGKLNKGWFSDATEMNQRKRKVDVTSSLTSVGLKMQYNSVDTKMEDDKIGSVLLGFLQHRSE